MMGVVITNHTQILCGIGTLIPHGVEFVQKMKTKYYILSQYLKLMVMSILFYFSRVYQFSVVFYSNPNVISFNWF